LILRIKPSKLRAGLSICQPFILEISELFIISKQPIIEIEGEALKIESKALKIERKAPNLQDVYY
jgi:hypothetical protein